MLDDINKSITFEKESSIQFGKKIGENRKDFSVQKSNQDIEILKSTYQTKIGNVKRKKCKKKPL